MMRKKTLRWSKKIVFDGLCSYFGHTRYVYETNTTLYQGERSQISNFLTI